MEIIEVVYLVGNTVTTSTFTAPGHASTQVFDSCVASIMFSPPAEDDQGRRVNGFHVAACQSITRFAGKE